MKTIRKNQIGLAALAVILSLSLHTFAETDHSRHNHGTDAVEQASAEYPLTTCIVSDEPLEEDYKSIQYQGREVRFCCNGCKRDFKKDPDQYMKKLNAQAKPAYPLTTCVVSGEELDSMGGAYVFTHGGMEIQLCCASCKKKFLSNPEKYMSVIQGEKEATPAIKADGHSSHDHSGHHHE